MTSEWDWYYEALDVGRKVSKDEENAETMPGLVAIPGHAAAVDISTGDSHVAVVTADGQVWAWGTFRTSSGLWAFTPDTQMARTPIVCYTPDSAGARAVTVVGWCKCCLNPRGFTVLGFNAWVSTLGLQRLKL